MINTTKRIWEIATEKKEGWKAYSLFLDYLSLGNSRGLTELAERSGRPMKLLHRLASTYCWVSRSRAYDIHLQSVQMKAIEKSIADEAVTWAKNHAAYRHEEYDTARALIKQALEMLATPLYETTETDIQEVNGALVPLTIVKKPARWTKNTIPVFVETATKLFRLSLEMDTSRDRVTIDVNDPEHNLAQAKAAVKKLHDRMGEMVDDMIAADPELTPEEAEQELRKRIPVWCATDWNVAPELLSDEEIPEQLVTSEPGIH